MTSERADSFSEVQCIGLRFQPHRNAAFGHISVLERRYDGQESPMLHTKFRGNRPAGSGEEDFLRFLPYMGMAAILVM